MKTMRLAQYVKELDDVGKTRTARAGLFFRSLGLRFKLWNTARVMERERAKRRRARARA